MLFFRAEFKLFAPQANPARLPLRVRNLLTFLAASATCYFPAAAAAAQPGEVVVPVLQYKHTTLSNGLEVYSLEDHASPTVAVQVWYHVGSKDDPNGRSGFAHLFEHMMFKGNDHLAQNSFEELTENIGGENNAYTADDVTVYHEVVPSNYLEPILWAEAERMSSLAVTETNFTSEREVVKEEYRQRIAANPYGEFFLAIPELSYLAHPYKRPGIGNIAELNASKLAEVQAFHATFYRPDNATLIVVGDFAPAELDRWIGKYFGAIAKPTREISRVSITEPSREKDRKQTIYGAKAPLPAFAITYLGPSVRSQDDIVLDVAVEILAGGTSSRLYRALVYEQRLAQEASFNSELHQDLGLLIFRLVLASGKTVAEAEKALDQQIADVLTKGVSEAELTKAKNRFLTGKLFELETANGKAGSLGEAAVLFGNIDRVNKDLARIQAVTTDEVKEVLNKYLAGKKRVVIEYLPEAMKPKETTPNPQ